MKSNGSGKNDPGVNLVLQSRAGYISILAAAIGLCPGFIAFLLYDLIGLLACGAGAGMTATFNTPIAGVILAIELLLFEFRARSFIPLVIASTLATGVHLMLLGGGSMFHMLPTDFGVPRALPYYLVLGVLCGGAAIAFTKVPEPESRAVFIA